MHRIETHIFRTIDKEKVPEIPQIKGNQVLFMGKCSNPAMPCEPSYNLHELYIKSTVYGRLRHVHTKNHTKPTKKVGGVIHFLPEK